MHKIKRDDEIVVISGKDKGKRGRVMKLVDNGRAIVTGINKVKKHEKPNPAKSIPGGIVEKEAPVQVSNLAILNKITGRADRVGFKIDETGNKIRIFKSNSEVVDL